MSAPDRVREHAPNRVVGVIGHVDHGKTTLVGALTGTDTDRLPEEKRRGISIALGFAGLAAADGGTIDLIDMPGHERFVRTAVAGLTGADAILLAVAADNGVQPQTAEHVTVAALLGVRRAVLAITRADRATAAAVDAVAAAAAALLADTGIGLVAVHRTDATTGAGIAALAASLAALPARDPDGDGWAFLPVDRAFTVAGAGTVVTGTLRRGAVNGGDTLEAWPPDAPATPLAVRVRAVERRGHPTARAGPGGRTALNLRGVEPARLGRGTVLATPGALGPARHLAVALASLADAPALAHASRLTLHAGTGEWAVRLRLLDRDVLEPGARAVAELHATVPVPVPVRERFVLRIPSPPRTVAGGTVLATGAARRRRYHPPTLASLASRQDAVDPPPHDTAPALPHAAPTRDPAGALVALALDESGDRGTTLAALGHAAGVSAARAASLLPPGGAHLARRGGAVIGIAGWAGLRRRLLAPGARDTSPAGVHPALLDEAIAALLRDGTLARGNGRLARADAAADAAGDAERTRATERTATALLARVRDGGLAPPSLAELAPARDQRLVLERLFRTGALIRTHERAVGRDWAFHPDAIARARALLEPALLAHPDGLAIGAIGALLGITRRHAVPLLEHLDGRGITRRLGDRRVAGAVASARGPADA